MTHCPVRMELLCRLRNRLSPAVRSGNDVLLRSAHFRAHLRTRPGHPRMRTGIRVRCTSSEEDSWQSSARTISTDDTWNRIETESQAHERRGDKRAEGSFSDKPPLISLAEELQSRGCLSKGPLELEPAAADEDEARAPGGFDEEEAARGALERAGGLSVDEWCSAIAAASTSRGAAASMFSAALCSLAHQGAAATARDLLRRMPSVHACEPDTVAFCATAVACWREGGAAAAQATIEEGVRHASRSAAGQRRTKGKGKGRRIKLPRGAGALQALHEDAHLLVVCKPAGMLVHPGPNVSSGDKHTLVDALVARCGGGLSAMNGAQAPGIVHRLDRATSGAIMVAKDNLTHARLVVEWHRHAVEKEYLALVQGVPTAPRGRIVSPISGQTACSEWSVQEAFPSPSGEACSLLRVRITSGRKHQIRIHLASVGHPVLGDPLYRRLVPSRTKPCKAPAPVAALLKESKKPGKVVLLHAASLALDHPVTGERLHVDCPLPEGFQGCVDRLKRIQR